MHNRQLGQAIPERESTAQPLAAVALAMGLATPVACLLIIVVTATYPPAILMFFLATWLFVGILAGLPAVILGHIALWRMRKGASQPGDLACTLVGLVLGYVSVVGSLLIIAFICLFFWAISDPDFPFQ